MSETLFIVAETPISVGMALGALAAIVIMALFVLVIVVARSARARSRDAGQAARRAEDLEARLADMARVQVETVGRVQAMGEGLAARQSDLARLVNERLETATPRRALWSRSRLAAISVSIVSVIFIRPSNRKNGTRSEAQTAKAGARPFGNEFLV